MTWLATFAAFVALAFLPLAMNGVFDDFAHSLRAVAYGSTYNNVTFASFAKGWTLQSSPIRWLAISAAILFLSRRTPHAWTARACLLALAGATAYKPISPMNHFYLDTPLVLASSICLAVLSGLIISATSIPPKVKLLGILLVLATSLRTLLPESCRIKPSLGALAALRGEAEPQQAPVGYRRGPVLTAAYYSWDEYRSALGYLRTHTRPSTRVANALKGDPAIVSEVDRPSAFPAESITWLKMVARRDEPAFVEALERAEDSVALWSPGSTGPDSRFQVPQIEAAIRRLYRFEARFGSIEIWRRVGRGGSEEARRPDGRGMARPTAPNNVNTLFYDNFRINR